MIDFVSSWYRAKVNEFKARDAESKLHEEFISEASNIVLQRPTDGGWLKTDAITDREKGHLETDQLTMIREARKKYRWDPNSKAAVNTMLDYVMGEGISITPKSKDPMVWYVWREFWTAKRNKMALRQFEIVRSTLRDGEIFAHFFNRDELNKPTWRTTLRFMDALLVKNPANNSSSVSSDYNRKTTRSGIEHEADDVENVIAYWKESQDDSGEYSKVPAKEVHHIKYNADSDQKRGESMLQAILEMVTDYSQWLKNRIILNKMRSAIVLIRKISGTSTQLSSIVNNLKQSSSARTGETKRESIRGGTILTANDGVDYKFEAPNINANDVKEDGRNIKLNIAAGTNLPEYVFGDASNANFASTLIAESPFVKHIKSLQTFFEYHFAQLFRYVIESAVQADFLKAPDETEFLHKLRGISELTEQDDQDINRREKQMAELFPYGKMETPTEIFFGCDIQWPEIVHRVEKDLTDALQIQRASGWVSDQSASQRLGYDYSEEVRKQKTIEEEAKRIGNPLIGIKSGDGEAMADDDHIDNDIQDLMKSLTNEQRQAIMNANTQDEVLKALKIPMPVGNGTNGE